MFDWQTLDDENSTAPRPLTTGDRWSPPYLRAAILLLLIATILVGLWWARDRRESELRAALTEVILTETRIQALGAGEQARGLVDPDAPDGWAEYYIARSDLPYDFPTEPELGEVELSEGGTHARVEIKWSTDAVIRQTRAYRLVDGRWLRTPLEIPDLPLISEREGRFILRAPEGTRVALGDEGEIALGLPRLLDHLKATWPGVRLHARDTVLEIRPREFAPIVTWIGESDPLIANSPELADYDLASPLSAESQYRLAVTNAVLIRLISSLPPRTLDSEERSLFSLLHFALFRAEGRHHVLTPAELDALHTHWRAQFDGHELSPFDGPLIARPEMSEATQETIRLRQIALDLHLDTLVTHHGRPILGQIAHTLSDAQTIDLETLLTVPNP